MTLHNLTPLRQLPEILPRHNGKRISFSTVFRWTQKGCAGRKLATIAIGGRLYVSEESLRAFLQPRGVEIKPDRKARIAKAEARLAKAGF
jgi:hypothetical protein